MASTKMPGKGVCSWHGDQEDGKLMKRSRKCKRGSLTCGVLEAQASKRRHKKNGFSCMDRGGKNQLVRFQSLLSKEYILSRVFRKDGPPLGLEFDPPPANAFGCLADSENLPYFEDKQRVLKRRKVLMSPAPDSGRLQRRNIPKKKHGMGKALMTVWRATNSCNGKLPTRINFVDGNIPLTSTSSKHRVRQKSKNKSLKKPPARRGKVLGNMDANLEKLHHTECKLLIDEENILDQSNAFTALVDDEELELRELEAGPTRFRCSAHLGSSGGHGCPLCKDLLPRFPPKIVKMKQPIATKPWDSSPELVKKLFMVSKFLYNHATAIDIWPFTLHELAQAFNDKDSLLLGKIHLGLLKLLLLSVEQDISAGFIPRSSKDSRFLSFLHFIREHEFDVSIWTQSLNSLSWTEILRQVLIAAGFGSKDNIARREFFSKERIQMAKYGLCPRTLKGELFSILSKQGSLGLKLPELAKAPQIVTLDLPSTTEEQEQLIYTALSSDITLFEKIGPVSYRLRINTQTKGTKGTQSEEDDSGSVDDESSDASTSDNGDYFDVEISGACKQGIIKYNSRRKTAEKNLIEYTEIDESYSGEAWIQGLVEGDYTNLSIGEKLDALVALVDLVGACSTLRTVEPAGSVPLGTPSMQYLGSGAKIKRLPYKSNSASSSNEEPVDGIEQRHVLRDSSRTDSSLLYAIVSKMGQSSGSAEATMPNVHPLKSIHLGCDRRYNSYWLFLGPCDATDPGHRCIYFESSEDGYWQVIDTTQALRDLLLALDSRGTREAHLFASLVKCEPFLCQAMDDFLAAEYRSRQTKGYDHSELDTNSGDGSSPISDVDNILASAQSTDSCTAESGVKSLECESSSKEKMLKWDRFQAFDRWIWSSFYSTLNTVKNYKRPYMESLTHCESCHDLYWRDEKHCKVCHSTFEIDIGMEERYAIHVATCRETDDSKVFPKHKVLPSQLQALKAAIHVIERSMPAGAFSGNWKGSVHKLWVKRLRRTSSLSELVQALSDFVAAMNEEWLYKNVFSLHSNASMDEVIVYFQTMPQTTSAVSLWMVKLDRLIAPYLEKLQSERRQPIRPQLEGK